MSGFIGLAHFDGQPVDRELLYELTESMASRGPDGRRIWSHGAVGLGFAKFATTEEAEREEQPLSLDGEVWIVADARIDGRAELVARLGGAGRENVRGATDAELILHAYQAWGEDAPTRLLGDFSFAIWDRPRRRLFCARDHFGIKPFYYAEERGGVVFSNALDCLRRHPAVGSELDDLAVADFLLFESNQDPSTTTFVDIRRLPPAHALSWSAGGCAVRRYWRLPDGDSPAAEPADGWIERFRALLAEAVEDRLRSPRVAVLMSGGLDSTAVAATAQRLLKELGGGAGVSCFTACYEQLIPDLETSYARMVADHLNAPLQVHRLDAYRLVERWGVLPRQAEPREHSLDAMVFDIERAIGAQHRVALTGFGGDPMLYPFVDYFLNQLRRGRIDRAARYLIAPLVRGGSRPSLGLHRQWLRWRLRRHWRDGYPNWLAADFEDRQDLEARWRWYRFHRRSKPPHRSHPDAGWLLLDIFWPNSFEQMDAAVGVGPVERRHPLFDRRLVELVLEAPPMPWCIDKHLLREAMRGVLPEAVRRRPKTRLAGWPRHRSARPLAEVWAEQVRRVPAIARYVRPEKVAERLRQPDPVRILKPFCLAHWLEGSGRTPRPRTPPGNASLAMLRSGADWRST